MDRKQGARALQYLSKIQDSSPAIELLRAEASESAGLHASALRIVDGLRPAADADPRVGFALGIACARMGLYDCAETAFNGVLAKRPDDFDVLFNPRGGELSITTRAQRVLTSPKLRRRRGHAV